MTVDVEPTHRFAECALGALKKIGLPATPRNFELWYVHAEGKNPALSRDIQIATDAFGKIDQAAADKLYKTHIQHGYLSRNVMEITTRFQEEISDLYELIEQTGESALGHNETLSGLSDQLRLTTEEFPAVGQLLEGVITVAKTMRDQNEHLETRLADSANEISSLQRSVEVIKAEAMKDPLTGVSNRITFDKALEEHIKTGAALEGPLALVFADIDHFKLFNDQWGHQTGDQVLRLVAEVMDANVKGQDLLSRYGGEEFAILLPETSLENARRLADRMRKAVESRRLKKRRTNEDLGVVTMSLGVAQFKAGDTGETLIERADRALYAAKDAGRNQVVDESQLANDNRKRQSGAA